MLKEIDPTWMWPIGFATIWMALSIAIENERLVTSAALLWLTPFLLSMDGGLRLLSELFPPSETVGGEDPSAEIPGFVYSILSSTLIWTVIERLE